MSITLTDLCTELNNWFDTNADGEKDRLFGEFTIENGAIDLSESDIKTGQYFRIIGSVFNDGVYQYPARTLVDETFNGAIWIMYVPKTVLELCQEIDDWNEKYGPIVASPFNSESFGGYSYYKGYKNTMSTVASSWKSKFAEQLQKWRKLRNI